MAATGSKRPTLQDVAHAAGVSTATVSRCLNEPQKVSEETRVRVNAAVKSLHYTPNFGARAIAAKRTGIFGAVIPTMANSIFAKGIEAFQKRLFENGRTMIVASSEYDTDREADLISTMVGRGADGLLLIGSDRKPETYEFLTERAIPFVLAWSFVENGTWSQVGFNNAQASQDLTSKALEMGHRRVAFVSAKTEGNDRARARVKGARAAMSSFGLDQNALRLIETNNSIEDGRRAFDNIARGNILPSLIVCGNDVLAAGVIQAAQGRGYNVPIDLSVTGFDDIDLASVISPSITTVRVPHSAMGTLAAETLLTLVDSPKTAIRHELETKLLMRGSLRPPAN